LVYAVVIYLLKPAFCLEKMSTVLLLLAVYHNHISFLCTIFVIVQDIVNV